MTRRGARTRRPALVCIALGLALGFGASCARTREQPVVHARFGVFFGGQVQERDEIPLILDRARQSIGLRLEFSTPPTAEARVRWELEKPRPGKSSTNAGSIVEYGEARTRPGEATLDVPLAFREGDRPGAWRLRVALDGTSVLDRPFKVVPASEAPNDD